MKKAVVLIIIGLVITGVVLITRKPKTATYNQLPAKTNPSLITIMKIQSPVFLNNQNIPPKYTCDGEDVNPPLEFKDIPQEAKSLALIVDDPDAPRGDWVHWLVWNISPAASQIAAKSVPEDAVEGMTDFGRAGWGGPCPPAGTHRYFFKLYALDTKLNLPSYSIKKDLLQAISGHIIAQAELVGVYQRNK